MRNLSLIITAVLAFGCTEDNDNANADDMGVGGAGGVGAGGEGGMGAGGEGGMGEGGAGGMGPGGEGGTGGVGGMGEGGMGEGGMGEGGMGGEGPSEACAMACTRLVDCAVDECMNFEAADGPTIDAWCQDACGAIPSFASVANGTETCGDLVAFGRQTLDPAFEMQCMVDPGNLEMIPECDTFGAQIAECFGAVCAPAADNAEVLTAAYTHICNESVANGSFGPMEALALGNADCDRPPMTDIIQEQVDNSAAFCADGPATDPAVCTAACEVIGPCIPVGADGEALRDQNRCEQFCLTTANFQPAQWQCIADAPMCGAAFQCLEGQPMPVEPVPECGPFGTRAAECIVEGGCESVGAIQGQTAAFSTTLCEQIVAAGQARPEDLVGIENAACDDARLVGFVAFLTVDTEDNPDDGSLAAVCAEGLVNPLETCTTACEAAGPCFPEDSEGAALRDPDFCTYFCATSNDVGAEIWQCLSGVEGCGEVGACFQPN